MAGIGLALGLGSAIVGGISAARQASAQNKAMADARRQNDQQARQFAQEQADAQQQNKLQRLQDENQAQMDKMRASSLLPSENENTTPGTLQTIWTSPLGDTTDPNLARKKILGG